MHLILMHTYQEVFIELKSMYFNQSSKSGGISMGWTERRKADFSKESKNTLFTQEFKFIK